MSEQKTVFVVRGPPWASILGVFSTVEKAMAFIGPACLEKNGFEDYHINENYDIQEEPLDPPGSLNIGVDWDDDD